MKRTKEAAYLRYILAAVVLFLIFILQYSGLAPLSPGRATGLLLVPSVVFCAMFMGEWGGAMTGLFVGVCMDCVMPKAVCFNALLLLSIGCLCGLFAHYVMHRNVYSALLLSSASVATYFFLKWIVFYAFTVEGAGYILWNYVLPSFFFTVLISLPLYFLFSLILKGRQTEVSRG